MLIHQFDITSSQFKNDPFPTLARMRQAGPVVRSKLPIIGKVWLVTTYAAVNEVLRDHQQFVREGKNAGKNRLTDVQWWLSRIIRGPAQNMLAKDEPDHRRLRGLVDDAFLRRSVESMRDRVGLLADNLLDQAVAAGGEQGVIDFLEFSRQFPLAVICELLGLPDDDLTTFTRWASGLSRFDSRWSLVKLLPNLFRMNAYFRQQIRTFRQHPRPGLLSLLIEVERRGDGLSEDELTAMAFLLLFAGHETTTHLISGGLLTLLDHPEQKQELMSDWTKCPSAVDELLRYNSPVQFTKPRIVARDTILHGQRVARGDYLLPMLASANCDPDQFVAPEQFDINRAPNPHLGFGTGIHVCLGLKLARLECEIALRRLLTRFPDLALTTPRDEVQWHPRLGVRALKSLPIQLNAPSLVAR